MKKQDFNEYWKSLETFKSEKTAFYNAYRDRFEKSRETFRSKRKKGKLTSPEQEFVEDYFGKKFSFEAKANTSTNT